MSLKETANKLHSLSDSDQFSGCVLLEQPAKAPFTFTCGYASKEYAVKNNLDTKFNIASIGKPVTAVAVTKLVQQQRLALQHPIGHYLKKINNPALKHITVEHLLTHTSGLGDYFGAAYDASYRETYESLDDFMDMLESATPAFPPGTKWEYSNLGYLLLGLLIEDITGQSYYDFIKEAVFVPAGMGDSGFWLCNEVVDNRATRYYFDSSRNTWRSVINQPVTCGTPSGGWYSTVQDLASFMRHVIDCDLLDPQHTHMLTVPRAVSPHYGYGFFLSNGKISHGGNGTGVNSLLAYYEASGAVLAILSNYSQGVSLVEQLFDSEWLPG